MSLEEIVEKYVRENKISPVGVSRTLGISLERAEGILRGRRRMRADELIVFCEQYRLDSTYFRCCLGYRFG